MNKRLIRLLLMSPLIIASITAVVVFIIAIIIKEPVITGIIVLFLITVLLFLKGLVLYHLGCE